MNRRLFLRNAALLAAGTLAGVPLTTSAFGQRSTRPARRSSH